MRTIRTIRLLLLCCLVCNAPACFGTWTWRNPSPTGNDLLAISYSSDYSFFTAVDRDGCIFTSPDGVTWNEPLIGSGSVVLTGVGAGGGVLVAVGGDGSGNGAAYTSSDGGMTWRETLSGSSGISFLNAVAYGNSEFVAVGIGGAAARSSDGVTWITENSPLAPNTMNGIAYGAGPGAFVAAGNGGAVYYSTDGSTWNSSYSGTNVALNAVAYGVGTPGFENLSGYFVIVGESVFLTTFLPDTVNAFGFSDFDDFGSGVTYDGVDNKFVTVDDTHLPGTFVSTNNGGTWSLANSNKQPPLATAIAYGNGKFVEVGRAGLTASSTDASNWMENATSTQLLTLTCGVYGATAFVASGGAIGGSGGIYTSLDGITWTPVTGSSVMTALNGTIPSDFIYANTQYIGVATDYGAGGITAPSVGVVLSSHDGTNWTTTNITSPTHTLTGIASGTVHGATAYVAVGNEGSIYFSPDLGAHWTYHPLGPTSVPALNGVIFGNSKFVAVGAGGLSAVSSDGQIWTTNNYSKLNTNLNAVAFGNGVFVAVGGLNGNYGVAFTSTDGLNWTQQYKYSTGITYQTLNSVTFANGAFVACGGGGAIFVSRDGSTWLPDNSGTLNDLTCALFGAGQYMVLGASGTILASSVLKLPESFESQLAHNAGSGTSFKITGTAGQSVIIEASTDLQHWSFLEATNLPQGGTVNFTDPDTLSTVKFYRAPYLP